MHFSSYAVLKNLLSDDKTLKAEKFLSEKSFSDLQKAPEINAAVQPRKFDLRRLIKDVHYSWFLPLFQKMQTRDRKIFLNVFEKNRFLRLQKNLNIKTDGPELSPLATSYLKKVLVLQLLKDHPALLPKEYLPDNVLSALLLLNKKELIELIHMLSLFDLAQEYFKIIDKKTLQKLNSVLSEREKRFLKSKRSYQDPLGFKSLNLGKFTANTVAFKALLHKKGLSRLAKALSASYFDFIWHIAHTLDIGRGQALMQMAAAKENPAIAAACQQNILELLPLINQGV